MYVEPCKLSVRARQERSFLPAEPTIFGAEDRRLARSSAQPGQGRRAVRGEVLAGSTELRHRRQRLSGRLASTKPNDSQATRSGAGRGERGVRESSVIASGPPVTVGR